jgi:hypothetical protein
MQPSSVLKDHSSVDSLAKLVYCPWRGTAAYRISLYNPSFRYKIKRRSRLEAAEVEKLGGYSIFERVSGSDFGTTL